MRSSGSFALLVSALFLASGLPTGGAGPPSTNEFTFASTSSRTFLDRVRARNGLSHADPVALLGRNARQDEGIQEEELVLDGARRYQRSGASVEGPAPFAKVTGRITHQVTGESYRQVPDPGPAIAAHARPRLEAEFSRMSVVLLLRPPVGKPMTAALERRRTFARQAALPLRITATTGEICTLYFSQRNDLLLGWTYVAETSEGSYPAIIEIEQARVVHGMRVPVVQRSVIGGKYDSRTAYQRVWVGPEALSRFVP